MTLTLRLSASTAFSWIIFIITRLGLVSDGDILVSPRQTKFNIYRYPEMLKYMHYIIIFIDIFK